MQFRSSERSLFENARIENAAIWTDACEELASALPNIKLQFDFSTIRRLDDGLLGWGTKPNLQARAIALTYGWEVNRSDRSRFACVYRELFEGSAIAPLRVPPKPITDFSLEKEVFGCDALKKSIYK